jgi:hypothetical protein
MVSWSKFVRNTPHDLLRDFMRRNGLEETSRPEIAAGPNVRLLAAVLSDADGTGAGRLTSDAERIMALADEPGQQALFSVVKDHAILEALENGQARSAHVYLNDAVAFRRAEEVRYTDDHRRGRMWEGFVAAKLLQVRSDRSAEDELKDAIRKHFNVQNVHIEVFARSRSGSNGESHELIQATIYRDGPPDTFLEFNDGQLAARSRRPVIEASLTYEPVAGVIEVIANARETRQAFVRYFAEHLLGIKVGSDRLPLRRYDLAALKRPYQFPTDPKDGIESVRVTCLRLMPFGTAGERVTLECMHDASKTVWQMAAEHFGDNDPLRHGWVVTQAKLVIKLRPTATMTRGRSLPLTISMPNGCDLKDRSEAERLIGDKYLRRWGILANV